MDSAARAGSVKRQCGIIGYGRIGRLIGEILNSPASRLALTAVADPGPGATTARAFTDYRDLLASEVPSVATATPPDTHFQIAMDTLRAGKDVLIEKPPCRSPEEARQLAAAAVKRGCVVFFAFHAAYNPAAIAAARYLRGREIKGIAVQYKENADDFHAENSWVHVEGVVRDSGINAFSVVTQFLDASLPIRVVSAQTQPGGPGLGPIRASLRYTAGTIPISFELDWRHTAEEIRTIDVVTESERCQVDISRGMFSVNGVPCVGTEPIRDMLRHEYVAMLESWSDHIERRVSLASIREIEMLYAAEQAESEIQHR